MAISFDNYGVKKVSKTDVAKKAYVPNKQQVAAIEDSGISGSESRPAEEFKITVLGDPVKKSVGASYYHALRKGATRTPEPRMGHEIASWLRKGDYVLIGNVGACLFIEKVVSTIAPGRKQPSAPTAADIAKAAQEAAKKIMALAKKAKGKPKTRKVDRTEFIRSPIVAAGALIRASGKCEMPGCTCVLFLKDNGASYLEVHHITPLSEKGDDSLVNAAALCPHHHRELHFAKNRLELRQVLRKHVAKIPV
ncbi:HNH endonuclease [Frateuria hangzhouensis]|uniref:HNH endonuclease n=1 Tax=Frateuria hangzhouensis TaxID=2995589 RepID=UPI0022608AB3|nr:HNH endonuclease signature motif containing protein [Frateuria sp. STR12]MCX7513444.1 HNH endonuclease signature motif containing protein [Frateuria sp. STR12]